MLKKQQRSFSDSYRLLRLPSQVTPQMMIYRSDVMSLQQLCHLWQLPQIPEQEQWGMRVRP